MKKFLNLFVLFFLISSVIAATNVNPSQSFKSGLTKMMSYYDPQSGIWHDKKCIYKNSCTSKGWWYWANAFHILADYQLLTGNSEYDGILENTFKKNKNRMIGRYYFDDEGWWALALIKAYQATHQKKYLIEAENIAEDMHERGKQNVCGDGGVYWDVAKTQVGSIANELFISVTAKLYLITKKPKYKIEANNTWNWFEKSGLLNNDFTIADHYDITDGKCGNKLDWKFTYTHGVILSALADLAKINNDPKLLTLAKNIATNAIKHFSSDTGVLTEECASDNTCSDDAFLFKGIFVHNLAILAKDSKDKAFTDMVKNYLNNNFNVMVKSHKSSMFGFIWSLPIEMNRDTLVYNPYDIVTQISALYLIDANLIISH